MGEIKTKAQTWVFCCFLQKHNYSCWMHSCAHFMAQKSQTWVIPYFSSSNKTVDSALNRERQCPCPRSSKPKTNKCFPSCPMTT